MKQKDIELANSLLQKSFDEFRLSIGLGADALSEKALEHLRKALDEYTQKKLLDFCSHLNTYEGQEEARFDFMLVDFNQP